MIPDKFEKHYLSITYIIITFFTLAYVWYYLDLRLLISYFIAVCVGTLGTNVGYHRLFSHKAFKTSRAWTIVLAFLGVYGTVSGPVGWVATHLHHHRYMGKDNDPHTPWTEKNIFKGWLRTFIPYFMNITKPDQRLLIGMRHLFEDKIIMFLNKYAAIQVYGTGILIWLLLGFDWFLILFAFPIGYSLISQYCVNWFHYDLDFVHKQRWWINIIIGGEGNHKYHHEFPRDYSKDYPIKYFINFIKI